MQMTLQCILAAYALLGATSGNIRPRADLDIREVRSLRVGNHIYRAFLGYDETYPFLVVEQVRLPLTEGDESVLVASWKMRDMDGSAVIRPREGDDIKDLRWSNSDVDFALIRGGKRSACAISNIVAGRPKVSCNNT
jgi:hypothetical protein